MKQLDYSRCFICGPLNPDGLRIQIEDGDQYARCSWVAASEYTGYENIIHGGILASILDDVIGHASFSLGVDALTAHLEVDYRKPVYVGDEIVCEARVNKIGKGRSIEMKGIILKGEEVVAEAKAVLVKVSS